MTEQRDFLKIIDKHGLDTKLKSLNLDSSWQLEIKQEGVFLYTPESKKPFSLDFSKLQTLSRGQPLAKAIGCKNKESVKVLDLTAGWGQDAFLLAGLGYQVVAIESHPLIFAFLLAAISKENFKKPNSLQFMLDNSLNYLKNIKEEDKPDVIYIDPMFKGKKSLSSRPLKILETLVGPSHQAEQMFQQALTKANKKVVVKRHRLEPEKQGAVKLCTFAGRSVCYDVFTPKK